MKYTEGICQDGAAILKDGIPITITEMLNSLNELDVLKDDICNISKDVILEILKNKQEKFSHSKYYRGEYNALEIVIEKMNDVVSWH